SLNPTPRWNLAALSATAKAPAPNCACGSLTPVSASRPKISAVFSNASAAVLAAPAHRVPGWASTLFRPLPQHTAARFTPSRPRAPAPFLSSPFRWNTPTTPLRYLIQHLRHRRPQSRSPIREQNPYRRRRATHQFVSVQRIESSRLHAVGRCHGRRRTCASQHRNLRPDHLGSGLARRGRLQRAELHPVTGLGYTRHYFDGAQLRERHRNRPTVRGRRLHGQTMSLRRAARPCTFTAAFRTAGRRSFNPHP